MAQPDRNRLRIDVFPTGGDATSDEVQMARADAAVLSLARLIGRQMAREQFERKIAQECRTRGKRPADGDA